MTLAVERRTRPAVIPWRWPDPAAGGHIDICTTIDAGQIRFIARDILEAIDALVPELAGEPTHVGRLSDHATATSWHYDYAVSVLESSDHPNARPLHTFLYSLICEIEARGITAFEQSVTPHFLVRPDEPTLI
ncbi:hypothetical protein [Herbiconiux sp. VKM Ac-2851]|uniref:hypothetical protein n=1 Tax=Herbiconiux sp. VKM Ac-2851 TaxID=2739025 RepID=UPI0015660099|nr:hypothetical protein [Herbiconiux sp. VKM Ac-2851]NQX36288.1 hypothetical protein [Herbiconiux sp. VKM Ac-2851]